MIMSKQKDPAFLFYSKDFYEGTRLMTPEERGCYVDLLIYQHQNGIIPEDTSKLHLYCSGCSNQMVNHVLNQKFNHVKNGWLNVKLNDLMISRKAAQPKKIAAACLAGLISANKLSKPCSTYIKGNFKIEDFIELDEELMKTEIKKWFTKWLTKWLTINANAIENVNANVIEDKNVDENVSEYEVIEYPAFSDFWDMYDKKRGDVGKIKSKWSKLTQSEKEAIIDYLPAYIANTQDKKFRKDPLTFLNNKSWNDEIITENKPGRKPIAKLEISDFD